MTLGWTDPAYGAGARWLQRERNGPDRSPIDAVPARLRRAGNPPRAHRSLPRPQLPLARTALTSQSAFPLCAVAHEHSSCHGSFPIPARALRPSPDGPSRAATSWLQPPSPQFVPCPPSPRLRRTFLATADASKNSAAGSLPLALRTKRRSRRAPAPPAVTSRLPPARVKLDREARLWPPSACSSRPRTATGHASHPDARYQAHDRRD